MRRRIPKEIKEEILSKVQAGERVVDLAEQYCGGYLAHTGVISPSGTPTVVMVQATQHWNGCDRVMGLEFVAVVCIQRIRNTVNALVGTRMIKIVDVFVHHPS